MLRAGRHESLPLRGSLCDSQPDQRMDAPSERGASAKDTSDLKMQYIGLVMEIIKASDRTVGVGPAECFTGDVTVERYAQAGEPARVGCAKVVFSAGARTA